MITPGPLIHLHGELREIYAGLHSLALAHIGRDADAHG